MSKRAATRAAEPELAKGSLLALVADNARIQLRLVRTAVRYWAAYPDEIDAEVDTAERTVEQTWQRELIDGAIGDHKRD